MNKASRWLDLVAFLLQYRFPVTREQIFGKVNGYDGDEESARRKFERDKAELRALGIEIDTVPLPNAAGDEPGMGYRLRPRSTYLPYLELLDEPADTRPYQGLGRLSLTRDELDILDRATRALAEQTDTPFAAAAASARRKLAFDLPLSSDVAERILALPVPEHARQALEVLQNAVIERAAVSCQYFTMSRRTEAERELEPWGLLFQWGRWYCVARARDRDEPRLFRVDRMRDVKRIPGSAPHFDLPDDFHVRTFAGRSPWEFGTGAATTAVVRFAFPESRWVVNSGVGRVMREEDDRSLVIDRPATSGRRALEAGLQQRKKLLPAPRHRAQDSASSEPTCCGVPELAQRSCLSWIGLGVCCRSDHVRRQHCLSPLAMTPPFSHSFNVTRFA